MVIQIALTQVKIKISQRLKVLFVKGQIRLWFSFQNRTFIVPVLHVQHTQLLLFQFSEPCCYPYCFTNAYKQHSGDLYFLWFKWCIFKNPLNLTMRWGFISLIYCDSVINIYTTYQNTFSHLTPCVWLCPCFPPPCRARTCPYCRRSRYSSTSLSRTHTNHNYHYPESASALLSLFSLRLHLCLFIHSSALNTLSHFLRQSSHVGSSSSSHFCFFPHKIWEGLQKVHEHCSHCVAHLWNSCKWSFHCW